MALSYQPPPPSASRQDVENLLGHFVPPRPPKLVASCDRASKSPVPDSGSARGAAPSCARPGEPPNKVYVLFSNDLEGFLPYTLLISEEQGLEFTSLSVSPDFTLDPLSFIEVTRVQYDALMQDNFFLSLARSVLARPELQLSQSDANLSPIAGLGSLDAEWKQPQMRLEERARPPYRSLVQLNVRRALVEGGQVLVFIAVQSEPLAEELTHSCRKLRKRRAARSQANHIDDHEMPHLGSSCATSRSQTPTRGCPTPRTVARTPPAVTPVATPQRQLTPPPQRPVRAAQASTLT